MAIQYKTCVVSFCIFLLSSQVASNGLRVRFSNKSRALLPTDHTVTQPPTTTPRMEGIVRGIDALHANWPWQVFIELAEGEDQCGGTLIDEKWIVSAAHCFSGRSATKVILGTINKNGGPRAVIRTVKRTCCHEDYNRGTWENDICMLELSAPVTMSDSIKPVALPAANTDVNDNTTCTVTGWGLIEDNIVPDILQEAQVKVININLCNGWYEKFGIKIPKNHFCAGHSEGGADTCGGDSGGPLVCVESDGYTLRGVTSFGPEQCGEKEKPGVYTKIGSYIEWITKKMLEPCPGYRWGPWDTPCSAPCGPRFELKKRTCLDENDAVVGNENCQGRESKLERCDREICPTGPHWGSWKKVCSVTCGQGIETRTRQCLDKNNTPISDESKCGSGKDTEQGVCKLDACIINYHWASWQSTCSVTCGRGFETRTRACLDDNNVPTTDTSKCGSDSVSKNNLCKMEDCVEYNWGSWQNTCSVTCGRGTEIGARMCLDNKGALVPDTSKCGPEPASRRRTCNLPACTTYNWGTWTASSCSVTCGQGYESRTRKCLSNNGDVTNDLSRCGPGFPTASGACIREDCEAYHWGPWRQIACSATCGKGTGTSIRSCVDSKNRATPDISRCGTGRGFRRDACNVADCLGAFEWSPWKSSCTVTCGSGVAIKQRQCLDSKGNRIRDVSKCGPGSDIEQGVCHLAQCTSEYRWGPWRKDCSVTCGTGAELRKRDCLGRDGRPASSTSLCPSGKSFEIGLCSEKRCPSVVVASACTWGAWEPWTTCRVASGQSDACNGKQERFRFCRYLSQAVSGSRFSNSIGGREYEGRSCTPARCNSRN